jgi:hypothetical protein
MTFAATSHGLHTEGVVVRFLPDSPGAWYGNFIGGSGGLSGAYLHPNQRQVVVVSKGQAYIVEPTTRVLIAAFGGEIGSVVEAGRYLVLAGFTTCHVIQDVGERWETRRLSWDGIQNLRLQDGLVVGEALSLEDTWITFRINLGSRQVSGGSY